MLMNLKLLLRNKVLFYLVSRYITYGVQFIVSLVIAVQLGPYYMGIWGFILLLLQYFQQFHLGIANSFNVLYVHHRDSQQECNNYIGNSIILVSYLSLLVLVFYLYYTIWGIQSFSKYHVDNYIIWICLIAILQYFVQFFINLFRVKNQLNRVTFCQSVIIFLNFFCVFFFQGEELIKWLVAGYVIGNMLCVLLAITSGSIPKLKNIQFNRSYQSEILKKGIYLFLYNSCFYFIIISIRTIISGHYSVEEFGLFTFSFTLAHAILLLLEALSFVIFPKVIGKLSSDNKEEVISTLTILRGLYITAAHMLIYIALICFPLLLHFFPKYADSLMVLNLISLTILINTNSYGYLELLISKNKEKTSALISFVALFINCLLALVFVYVFHCTFSYVILATMITYFVFSLLAMSFATKLINLDLNLNNFFPLRLLVPYAIAVFLSIMNYNMIIWLPLVLAIIFNRSHILKMSRIAMTLVNKPEKVNI